MALVLKDRVQETTTTTGTGTITLAGAVTGFQSFSVIGNGNTCYYAIVGDTEWEVGLGTYTSSGTTLSRDTILESSNGGTAVNFSAGTKNVFVTYPAEKSIYQNASGVANLTSTDVTTALGYTPVTNARTLTVNGTAYDLSANRTWSVGTVTSVTGASPIASTGGTTPEISISQATTSTNGYLSSTDWNTFNGKAPSVTYTTNYIPYGQGTTTPALSANFTYNGTTLGLTSTNATGTISITDTGTSGANLKLVGNGATTPNKTIRAQSGNFSIVNSGYTSEIFTLSDAGVITTSTWNGAKVEVAYGGTGATTLTGLVVGNGTSAMTTVTAPSGTVVGTSDTQTLTNKTITGTKETVYTITDGAAFEIDPANGGIQIITLGASRTPKGTNFTAGQSVTLMIDDGTAYTITWTDTTFGTGGVTWVGGAAPSLATSGYTIVELWKVSSKVYGAYVGTVA